MMLDTVFTNEEGLGDEDVDIPSECIHTVQTA